MLSTIALLAAEGGEKAANNPVIPTVPEMVWGAIAFVALMVLMWAVLLPPLKKAMRQREEQARTDLESAEKATVEAEQVRRDYDATLAEARAEAGRIVDEARVAADTRRAELVRAADAEIVQRRQEVMAELDQMRQQALGQLRGEVGGIAVAAAGKVVGKELSGPANQAVVDEYVTQAGGIAGPKEGS